jgi:hypothetical protein
MPRRVGSRSAQARHFVKLTKHNLIFPPHCFDWCPQNRNISDDPDQSVNGTMGPDGSALYKNHPIAHETNLAFEELNTEIKHRCCSTCKQVSTNLVTLKRTIVCTACRKKQLKDPTYVPPWLPTWTNEENKMEYEVPECLKILREGEKLLIQRVSTYVPLRYLKGGSHGSRGHVCSFPKDIQEFVTELPRQKVEAIRVVRSHVNKDKEVEEKTFTIRKSVVLNALIWLKKHSKHYRDIIIVEENFEWMEGKEEAELAVNIVEEDKEEREGPEEDTEPTAEGEIPTYGIISHDTNADLPKKKDDETRIEIEKLRSLSEKKKRQNQKKGRKPVCTMRFPTVESEAVDEYDASLRIFCLAFPWLFPGGRGDWADVPSTEGISVEEWAKALLFYEDGRFAKDKIWCFYALNYAQRRQNMKQGEYFVKNFLGSDSPKTIEELQEVIEKGDTSWIDKICYFGSCVKGGTAYWRQRRDEIHSWIQHHVLECNGAPTLFLTLSCAEHYWPDIAFLLKERDKIANEHSEPGQRAALINEYTIVIQEYFQKRVQNWLDTVGKMVFKIKHHWLRFEFAPGRGQIHAHCLLIVDNMDTQKEQHMMKQLQDAMKRDISNDLEHERAKVYQRWAENDLCITTRIPDKTDDPDRINIKIKKEDHPANKRLSEINDIDIDGAKLLLTTQTHLCTEYCMRKRKIL